jgi:hypothetical protein
MRRLRIAALAGLGDEPFGVFESLVRGCIEAKRFRAVALDAFGQVLGRSRVPFRRSCLGDAGSVGIVVRTER